MAARIQVKEGETLTLTCVDTVGDLTTTTIEAAGKIGGFYRAFTVTKDGWDAGAGEYTYTLTMDTTNVPIGTLECDIKYTDASEVVTYQPTFGIAVIESVTQ